MYYNYGVGKGLHLEVHFKWTQGHDKKWYDGGGGGGGREIFFYWGGFLRQKPSSWGIVRLNRKGYFALYLAGKQCKSGLKLIFPQIWKTNILSGEDYSKKKLMGVCGLIPKTLTIFMIRPKIKHPVYDRCGWHRWRGLVHGFIDNDEKVASSKQHTQFKSVKYKNHTLFKAKMAKIDTLFMIKTAEKPYPLGLHIT